MTSEELALFSVSLRGDIAGKNGKEKSLPDRQTSIISYQKATVAFGQGRILLHNSMDCILINISLLNKFSAIHL
jgi:hypothetical protein